MKKKFVLDTDTDATVVWDCMFTRIYGLVSVAKIINCQRSPNALHAFNLMWDLAVGLYYTAYYMIANIIVIAKIQTY